MPHLGVVPWITIALVVWIVVPGLLFWWRSTLRRGSRVPVYETVLLTALVSPFVMAFASKLGERLGTAVRIERLPWPQRWRRRRELAVTPARARGRSIILEVHAGMSDEARLALIELDLDRPELWGHRLRWDEGAQAWLPVPESPGREG